MTIGLLATFPIRRYASTLGLMDLPGERSSHAVVTPRGGGIAIMVGAGAALAILATIAVRAHDAFIVFAAAAGVGIAGIVDDRHGLHPFSKLAVHLAAGFIVITLLGPLETLPAPPPIEPVPLPMWAGWVLSLVWFAAVVNFFNFMDGIDGLAAAQAIASCVGIIAAAWSADAQLVTLVVGGACLGFLFHNAPPARVFMGDSGSGFLGFVLAAAPFMAAGSRRSDAILATAIGLTLFLLDPVYTLSRRALERKNILRAHREHLYQQLVAPLEPAGPVTAGYAIAAFFLSICGAVGYRHAPLMWIGIAGGLLAFAIVLSRARRRDRMIQ